MDIHPDTYSLKPMACLGGRVLAAYCTDKSIPFGNTPARILIVVIVEKVCTHKEWEAIVYGSATWEEAADAAIAKFGGFSMLLPEGEQYDQSHLGAILSASLVGNGIAEA